MSTTSLLSRFNAEKKAFARLKKLSESKVVRWDYWDLPKWYWDPADNFVRSRYLAEKTSQKDAGYGYGYDNLGRIVVIYRFGLPRPGKIERMEFLRYSGNKLVGSIFGPNAVYSGNTVIGSDWAAGSHVSNVFEATLSEGRIVMVEQLYGSVEADWNRVEWRGDEIAKVAYGAFGRKAHLERVYGKNGKVVEEIDLSKPIKRKPLPKGVTMTTLAKEIRDRLAKAVVQTAIKAKIKEPVYCLALNYDCEGNPLLLPELGIGLESNRRALLKRGGRDAKLDIWDAANFPMFGSSSTALMGRDKKLDQACDLYNRELEYKGSDEPARKLILQVAADLAKMDWKGKLNTTDDFIVYAVDTDGADLRKNLKVSVPPKQLAKLKAARLI
jgi:hypothetical protein